MARKKSTERQLAERFVKGMMSGSHRSGNGDGKKGLTFVPLILVAILCVWTQCNPVPVPLENEQPSHNATTSSDSVTSESTSPVGATGNAPVSTDVVSDENYAVPSESEPQFELETTQSSPTSIQGERVNIERAVDGDTLIVFSSNGRERVRLIGANTPETVKKNWPVEPYGPEASAYTKRRVAESGNVATLVSDGDRQDKYGRRLAFVYLGNDTVSLNEELVRVGLAQASLQYRFSRAMKDRLAAAEAEAKSERRGIHSLSR